MAVGIVASRLLGFEFDAIPILLIAVASPAYNALFAWAYSRYRTRLSAEPSLDFLLTALQVVADYTAMFLLIHFTGGARSPLVVFLLFHVIIAAVQFSPAVAYLLAAWAAGGLWLMFAAEQMDWLSVTGISFQGQPILQPTDSIGTAVTLAAIAGTLFVSAAIASRIMDKLREGVDELTRTGSELAAANARLSALYEMVGKIGRERRVGPIVETVTASLASVLGAAGVAIELLSEDGNRLSCAASYGVPGELLDSARVPLAHSPLHQRVLAGETLLELGALDEHLRESGGAPDGGALRATALAPLRVEDRPIGVLTIYGDCAACVSDRDREFLALAAELVAIAIADAAANEAIESLMQERTRFMLQVAHNLRAPVGASLSLVDLLRGGYTGRLTETQDEHLSRIEGRLRTLDSTVSALLAIARARDWTHEIPDVVVDLAELAAYAERTYEGQARHANVRLDVERDPELPGIPSGADLLERLVDNLVSNAIKYTPPEGEVHVRFMRRPGNAVRIMVEDNGIGIPAGEQAHLFEEFFRASNARERTSRGTGLGLTFVKECVERHRGQMYLASDESTGTTIVVDLPLHRPERSRASASASANVSASQSVA
jgi:signal transduction histidine kinase